MLVGPLCARHTQSGMPEPCPPPLLDPYVTKSVIAICMVAASGGPSLNQAPLDSAQTQALSRRVLYPSISFKCNSGSGGWMGACPLLLTGQGSSSSAKIGLANYISHKALGACVFVWCFLVFFFQGTSCSKFPRTLREAGNS